MGQRLTHLDQAGSARMVDVSTKPVTARTSSAECLVLMSAATRAAVTAGELEKGDALQVARLAGIMAAKRTPDLIPLCHALPLAAVGVEIVAVEEGFRILAEARVQAQTGVEMEALTAAAVAGLTLIDMVKSLEPGVSLGAVRLLEKSGGKSGRWRRNS